MGKPAPVDQKDAVKLAYTAAVTKRAGMQRKRSFAVRALRKAGK